jgi:hypothetical protein
MEETYMPQGIAVFLIKIVLLLATLAVLVPLLSGCTVKPISKDKMTWLGAFVLCVFPPLVLCLLPFISITTTGTNTTGESLLQRIILYFAGTAVLSRRQTLLNLRGVPAMFTASLILGVVDYFVSTRLQLPALPFLH